MNGRGTRTFFQALFVWTPIVVLAYVVTLYTLIRRTALRDDAQPADIIVVLGAAQYNGRPSPVFKARLDHTASLYSRRLANRILTTGGYGPDARYSEAGVGKAYLVKHDIPGEHVLTEPSGLTTTESLEKCIELLKSKNFTRVIAVSDGFHLFRVKWIFSDHQITVFGSPAQNSLIESNFKSRAWASLREVFVFTAYLMRHRWQLPIEQST